MVTELNDETVRETSLYSNRILYKIKASHIDVLAVIHKRRDLQPEEIPRDQLIKATTTTAWMQDAGCRMQDVEQRRSSCRRKHNTFLYRAWRMLFILKKIA